MPSFFASKAFQLVILTTEVILKVLSQTAVQEHQKLTEKKINVWSGTKLQDWKTRNDKGKRSIGDNIKKKRICDQPSTTIVYYCHFST